MLYYKGNANLNASRVVAIVGTRNVTEYGKENCVNLVNELVDEQVLVVSGLAYGVDTIAHRSSVKAGIPTVGVLGNGFQQIYPAANKKLAAEMSIPLLAQIPVVQSICENGDSGTPAALNIETATGQAFLNLAQAVLSVSRRKTAKMNS